MDIEASAFTRFFTTLLCFACFALHSVQLLLNKQQQIWGGVYIHWHFSSSRLPIQLISPL